ncbi:hypothetical protein DDD63_00285 [Actinobaculum sp. 313]|nr:hypothetical protein DDD63_00285 [Actinobaculum sp. 313]
MWKPGRHRSRAAEKPTVDELTIEDPTVDEPTAPESVTGESGVAETIGEDSAAVEEADQELLGASHVSAPPTAEAEGSREHESNSVVGTRLESEPGSGRKAIPGSDAERETRATAKRGPWKFSWLSLVPALIALLGMLVLAYPTAASWIAQYNQSKVISKYSDSVNSADPSAQEQLRLAYEYNDALRAGAILEANSNVPTGSGSSENESLDYNSMLRANSTGLMARLRISAIDLDLPVYHGTSDQTLLKGVGHLEGTSLPVGGESTRSVLTGHRGLAQATMFTNLDRLKVGDTFTIEIFDEVLTYRIYDKKVVEPTETEALRVEEGRDLVTLVTCTPLGINTHRILVTGERVYPTPQEDLDAAGKTPEIPRFPWWAVALLVGFVLIGVYIWRSGYPAKPRKKKHVGDASSTEHAQQKGEKNGRLQEGDASRSDSEESGPDSKESAPDSKQSGPDRDGELAAQEAGPPGRDGQ